MHLYRPSIGHTIGRYVDRESADTFTDARYIGRNSANISTDINRSVMGENDEVLGPAGEGRDDGSYKIDANLLLSKRKKKVKFF